MHRRHFIAQTGLAGLGLVLNRPQTAQAPPQSADPTWLSTVQAHLLQAFPSPIVVDRIQLWRAQKRLILQVQSEGAQGLTVCNERMEHLVSLLHGLVIPFFSGKDARQIPALVEEVFRDERNYKFAGMPFWNCVGTVEIAIWDLLGQLAQQPVHHFLGTAQRRQIPVYLSSLTRENSAAAEVADLATRLANTGAQAIKIKVGGRMRNTPEAEKRTQELIPLLRQLLPATTTIYADANGSYTPREGQRIAQLLEDYDVAIFEEPCAWEDYAGNLQVRRHLRKMKLAGGEQDTSLLRFAELAQRRVYDILQPDVYYQGGILRTLQVAHLAQQYGRGFAPHTPKADPLHAPFAQVAAVAPALYGFQEFPARPPQQPPSWYSPALVVNAGAINVLDGPGLGITYASDLLAKAEKLDP